MQEREISTRLLENIGRSQSKVECTLYQRGKPVPTRDAMKISRVSSMAGIYKHIVKLNVKS